VVSSKWRVFKRPSLAAFERPLTIWVLLLTVKLVAAVLPKWTLVAFVKPVPVIVTLVPPAVGPVLGLTPVTVGGAM
jgi:hypothetical protein